MGTASGSNQKPQHPGHSSRKGFVTALLLSFCFASAAFLYFSDSAAGIRNQVGALFNSAQSKQSGSPAALKPGHKFHFRFSEIDENTNSEIRSLSLYTTVGEVTTTKVRFDFENGYWERHLSPFFGYIKCVNHPWYHSFEQSFQPNPNNFFPLTPGKEITVKIMGRRDTKSSWEHTTRCSVVGNQEITVTAGTFDTIRVLCFVVGSDQLRVDAFYDPHKGITPLVRGYEWIKDRRIITKRELISMHGRRPTSN